MLLDRVLMLLFFFDLGHERLGDVVAFFDFDVYSFKRLRFIFIWLRDLVNLLAKSSLLLPDFFLNRVHFFDKYW